MGGTSIDGVGYNFGESVRMYLTSIGRDVEPATDEWCKSWDFYEQWGMTREEFSDICDAGSDAGFVFGDHPGLTRANFFESMARVHDMGHKVIVVTHRWQGAPGRAEANTHSWLKPYMAYIDEIHFSGDKTSVPTDMFVEDNKGNYDALVEAGVDAYLINRPWNGPYDDHRQRILDVEDYADAVAMRTLGLAVV